MMVVVFLVGALFGACVAAAALLIITLVDGRRPDVRPPPLSTKPIDGDRDPEGLRRALDER
jgi:hypothetical protein